MVSIFKVPLNASELGEHTMYRHLTSAVVATLLIISTGAAPASAKKKDTEKKEYVTIPVFFVTDRNVEEKDGKMVFGTDRQYLKSCPHDAHLGVAMCVVENNKHKAISAPLASLGWTAAKGPQASTEEITDITDPDYEKAEVKFYTKLNEKVAATPDREAFVFVPGYMSTLESGLTEAARFAYYSERPLVLFSWASGGKVRKYSNDESNIAWSQDHFDHVLTRLSEMRKLAAEKPFTVRIFAHSMGARLVLAAVPIFKENPAFSEVSLICPDVDDGLFQHYVSKYGQAKGSANFRLYLSHRDKMLAVSKKIHGGHLRLGQTSLSDNQGKISHPPDEKEAIPVTLDLRRDDRRFQTLDVTELDRGGVGHKIPVELMCSISQTGRPNEEFKVVTSAAQAPVSTGGADSSMSAKAEASYSGYMWVVPIIQPKLSVVNAVKEKVPSMRLIKAKDWTIK